MPAITREMLRDYINDALPDGEIMQIETALRSDEAIRSLLREVQQEAERGEHSVGAIWRRERISCPTREQIGSYILQALDDDFQAYIEFHLNTIGCPACQANFDDLQKKHVKPDAAVTARRQRIVDSSVPALQKARKK